MTCMAIVFIFPLMLVVSACNGIPVGGEMVLSRAKITLDPTASQNIWVNNTHHHKIGDIVWTVEDMIVAGISVTGMTIATVTGFTTGETTLTAEIWNETNDKILETFTADIVVNPTPEGMALITITDGRITGGIEIRSNAQAILVNQGQQVSIAPQTLTDFIYISNRTENSVLAWRHQLAQWTNQVTFTVESCIDFVAVYVNSSNLVGKGLSVLQAPNQRPPDGWSELHQGVFELGTASGIVNSARSVTYGENTINLNYFRIANGSTIHDFALSGRRAIDLARLSSSSISQDLLSMSVNFPFFTMLVHMDIIWIPEMQNYVAIRLPGIPTIIPPVTMTSTRTLGNFQFIIQNS